MISLLLRWFLNFPQVFKVVSLPSLIDPHIMECLNFSNIHKKLLSFAAISVSSELFILSVLVIFSSLLTHLLVRNVFFFYFFETWKVKVFIKKLWESVGKVALPGTPVRSFLLWQCTDLFLIFIIHKVSLWTCRISSIFSRLSVEWLMQ